MAKVNFVTRETLFDDEGNATGAMVRLGDGREVRINLSDLSEEMIRLCAAHGLKQKLGDATAGFSADSDFEGAYSAMVQVRNAVTSGDFNRRITSTGGIWVEAVWRAKAKVAAANGEDEPDFDEVLAAWTAASEDQQKAIRKHPSVKLAKAELERERLEARYKAAKETATKSLEDLI